MKTRAKVLLVLITFIFFTTLSFAQIIIDHTCTEINGIPESEINKAKTDLHIAYGHTSHGSQLITGMNNLDAFMGGNNLYIWHDGPQESYLDIDDYFTSGDLGHNGDTSWAARTRVYLDDPANADVNVVIWSWCGGVSDNSHEGIQTYLDKMDQLGNDYPNVEFIYMTGHSYINSDEQTKTNNQQIRDYCNSHNKVLFDFENIEYYDPDNIFFEFVTDNCDYFNSNENDRQKLGNWATEWQDSHTQDIDWYDCSCAHSVALNCNQKAYAAWWMWARLVGWDGTPLPVELTLFTANANNEEVVLDWETVTEVNNYGFMIERKQKNVNWKELGFVEGHGNSNSPKNYSYIDNLTYQNNKIFYRLKQIDNDGTYEYSKTIEVNFKAPTKFNLSQNYPNPFNPTTTIKYSIPENSRVNITIYNSLGQLVTTLVNENQNRGNYNITWNGKDQYGNTVSSGTYLYKFNANNFTKTNHMLFIK